MTTKHNFKNREEIKIYLLEQMNELNRKGEFNIFVHQINNYKNYLDSGEDVLQKKFVVLLMTGCDWANIQAYSERQILLRHLWKEMLTP